MPSVGPGVTAVTVVRPVLSGVLVLIARAAVG